MKLGHYSIGEIIAIARHSKSRAPNRPLDCRQTSSS
jgi:hypothetical protein